MLRNVLFVSNLQSWITDEELLSLFPNCIFVHRDSELSAHVCYDEHMSLSYLRSVIKQMDRYPVHNFYDGETVELNVHMANKFKARRYQVILSMQPSVASSLYLEVISTHKLSVREFKTAFPYAFDIYRLPGSVKAYIQFNTVEHTLHAYHTIHRNIVPFGFSHKIVNVLFGCRLVHEQEVIEYQEQIKEYCSEPESPSWSPISVDEVGEAGSGDDFEPMESHERVECYERFTSLEDEYSLARKQDIRSCCAKNLMYATNMDLICHNVVNWLYL